MNNRKAKKVVKNCVINHIPTRDKTMNAAFKIWHKLFRKHGPKTWNLDKFERWG